MLHLPLSALDAKDPAAPLGFYAAALRRLFDLDRPPAEGTAAERELHAPRGAADAGRSDR